MTVLFAKTKLPWVGLANFLILFVFFRLFVSIFGNRQGFQHGIDHQIHRRTDPLDLCFPKSLNHFYCQINRFRITIPRVPTQSEIFLQASADYSKVVYFLPYSSFQASVGRSLGLIASFFLMMGAFGWMIFFRCGVRLRIRHFIGSIPLIFY